MNGNKKTGEILWKILNKSFDYPIGQTGDGLDKQLKEQMAELKYRLELASSVEKASAVALLAAMLTKEQENHAGSQMSARQI